MRQNQIKRIEQIALFRFGVLGDLVHLQPGDKAISRLLQEKADCDYQIPFSNRTRISLTEVCRFPRKSKNRNSGKITRKNATFPRIEAPVKRMER
jgi:hypothetical protein